MDTKITIHLLDSPDKNLCDELEKELSNKSHTTLSEVYHKAFLVKVDIMICQDVFWPPLPDVVTKYPLEELGLLNTILGWIVEAGISTTPLVAWQQESIVEMTNYSCKITAFQESTEEDIRSS